METIQHAAIERSDGVLSVGKMHADITASSPCGTCKARITHGFTTSTGRFVGRQEAADIAWESGQIPDAHYELINGAGLISENLWDYCNFKYDSVTGYYK